MDDGPGLASSNTYETEIEIAAPVDVVFRHLTDPAAMVTWMGQHAELEPEPGGTFAVDINGMPVRGSFVTVDPPHRVVVTWGVLGSAELPAGSTQVEFTLRATEAGTHVRLVHSGLSDTEAPRHGEGWTHYLARLASRAAGTDPGPDPWADAAA